jgi:hypothetical protein
MVLHLASDGSMPRASRLKHISCNRNLVAACSSTFLTAKDPRRNIVYL